MKNLFGLPEPVPGTHTKVNPCIAAYGHGPEGTICGKCTNLIRYSGSSKAWFKCRLRREGGEATDHKYRWPSCGKFVEVVKGPA